MTEDQPKTKKDRTPAQLANDKRNSERLKAHWQAVKAANAKGPETSHEPANDVSVPANAGEKSANAQPETSHKPANTQPETPHPSIPPPKEEPKEAPAPPKRKPLRLLW